MMQGENQENALENDEKEGCHRVYWKGNKDGRKREQEKKDDVLKEKEKRRGIEVKRERESGGEGR